jgi:hypothetical protein
MSFLSDHAWEIAAGTVVLAAVSAGVYWKYFRKRPTPEELEHERRQFLVQSGRILDAMLLDICEVPIEDGRKLTMLLYSYHLAGVDYECSQDITLIQNVLDLAQIRAGFPCSVRYQPGNPHNSIVVAEDWSGIRTGLRVLPVYEDPEPIDRSHLGASR